MPNLVKKAHKFQLNAICNLENFAVLNWFTVSSSTLWSNVVWKPVRIRPWSLKQSCSTHIALQLRWMKFLLNRHGLGDLGVQSSAVRQTESALSQFESTGIVADSARPCLPCGGRPPAMAPPVRLAWTDKGTAPSRSLSRTHLPRSPPSSHTTAAAPLFDSSQS